MTQRSRLDAFLVEQAADAGADFRDGVRVDDLALLEAGVEARVSGDKVAAKWLVCADGVNGTTTRSIGLDDGRTYGVALEANVPYGVVSEEEYRGRLFLELANVPGGYGWVFPKGDHVNVGVGGWEREGPRLRDHLSRFCREYGIPESSLENVRGYRLPLLHARARLSKGARRAARRRGRSRRPALGGRHLRGVPVREARDRGDPRRRPQRVRPRAAARPIVPASGRLGGKGRARPVPAPHLRGRPDALPLEGGRVADRRRGPEPERDAWPAPRLDADGRGDRPRRRQPRQAVQDRRDLVRSRPVRPRPGRGSTSARNAPILRPG